MGLRDRFKKGGGGFLNNVAGVIVGAGFTTEPGWDNTSGRLYFRVDVQQDGADAPVSTHLDAGLAEGLEISEDGLSIEETGDSRLWNGTAFTQFYNSLVDHGLEDVVDLTFAHVVGVRAQFIQVKDDAKMERDKKNYKKSRGAINEQGQRKGKDGKFYDQRTLEVSEIFETGVEVEATPAPAKSAKGKTTKPASKTSAPAAKPAVKGKTAAPKADDGEALRSLTKDIVINVLEGAKDNKLMRTSLSTGIVKRFNQDDLKGDPRRDDVRKLAADEAFIAEMVEEGLITSEKNILALA